MKKWGSILIIAISVLVFSGIGKAEAAVGNGQRVIGLHDRILPIEDIQVIDGDTKVPLVDMEKTFNLLVKNENGKTTINKYGKEFVYDATTGITTLDGVEQIWKPIVDIDGKVYISVKFLTREIGFKMEYIKKIQTIRIYRDDFEHMSHEAFESKVSKSLHQEKPSTQGNTSTQDNPSTQEKPSQPTKPSKPTISTKPEQPAKKPVVYLTFDDGPNEFTLKNNETLNNYHVPGTFFFTGKQMKAHSSIVKVVADSGHYIGSHSMSHDKLFVYESTESFIAEMSGGVELVEKLTGKPSKLVRVPYGSIPHVTPAMKNSLYEKGYKLWDWDVDSNDWQYKDAQADQIFENVKDGVTKSAKAGKKDIVILMHDRSQTTIALPKIIEWLKEEGYTFQKYDPKNHLTKNFLKDPNL